MICAAALALVVLAACGQTAGDPRCVPAPAGADYDGAEWRIDGRVFGTSVTEDSCIVPAVGR